MSHVDDGLLHAYLDGALHAEDPAETERVERHLALCDDCRARLEAARGVRAQADALLEAATPTGLDMPPFGEIAARAAAPAAQGRDPGPDRAGNAGDRVALDTRASRRPRRFVFTRTLAWAASIIIALGMGWWARELAYQPGGLPQGSMELQDRAKGTGDAAQSLQIDRPQAADVAVSSAAAGSAAVEPGAPNAATEKGVGAGQAPSPSGAGGARQKTGAAVSKPPAEVAPTPQPTPTAQQPAAQRLNALREQARAKTAETPTVPSANLPTGSLERRTAAQPAPPTAADAAFRGLDQLGARFLTVAEAGAWLGGPVYRVQGLDVVGVVPSAAPDGARVVTVYQRLSASDTIGLHQQRPASGDAFTLGPGGTGLILNGTLIYTSSMTLSADSVRALLHRLVPLRH